MFVVCDSTEDRAAKGKIAKTVVLAPRETENRPRRAGFALGMEATIGFEPMNKGFADPRVRPLRHVAPDEWLALEDSNLGSRIQSPLSYH